MRLFKIFFLAVASLFAVSCESEMWSTEQPDYVDVYNIYDIRDTENVLELDHIDIYHNKPIMIETSDKGVLSIYDMIDYADNSNNTDYDISFRVEESDLSTGEVILDKNFKIWGSLSMGFVYFQITDNLLESDNIFESDALIQIKQILN